MLTVGALEMGGTKMVCAVGDESGALREQTTFPTETPEITLPKLITYFREQKVDALGIGCFGPIDLDRKSPTYGYITTTPKTAWRNCSVVGAFQEVLQIPVGFDTDVNGSALGEHTWGIGRGLDNCIYITIGTGIGVGVISQGKLLHGMLHPEGGHILLRPRPGDRFEGCCPFHGTCFEGMASGPAIEKRWGKKGYELADREIVWNLEAEYIAQALVNYTMVLSPQRIILGGGVMHQEQLLPMIRERFAALLNGYVRTKELEDLDTYIVLQSLDDRQGILGALRLGQLEYAAAHEGKIG